MTNDQEKDTFCVYAKVRSINKPLLMLGLSFGRVVDDVLIPFEKNEKLFLDGVPSNKSDILQIKILKETTNFKQAHGWLHNDLRNSNEKRMELVAKNYEVMLDEVIRTNCEDITAQVMKAFDNSIKPKLMDYLPKKEEIIKAGFEVLLKSLESLK